MEHQQTGQNCLGIPFYSLEIYSKAARSSSNAFIDSGLLKQAIYTMTSARQ
jgi:hypothetical protein